MAMNLTQKLLTKEELKFLKLNLDKKNGASIRLFENGSGVILHKPPFNLNFTNITKILEISQNKGTVETVIYEFQFFKGF